MKKRILSLFLSCLISLGVCACTAGSPEAVKLDISESSHTTADTASSEITNIEERSLTESKSGSSAISKTNESSKISDSSEKPSSAVSEKLVSSNASSKPSESSVTSQVQNNASPSDNTVTASSYTYTVTNTTSDVNPSNSTASESVQTQNENVSSKNTETYYTDSEEVTETDQNTQSSSERTLPDKTGREKKIVVIDAGHQANPDFNTEPIAPGSSEMKIKVSGGTTGVVTGIPEYELTLTLALKLQLILEERGYEVIQTRTTNDVNISNIERADVANNINADAFIRIHANGSDYSSVNGAMALCQTPNNPYNGHIYSQCYSLSENVLDELVASTGCNKQYIWETDTMCGINWSLVPVTIIEVGYMSNPQEDRLMATDEYQDKICVGIANGIDKFFGI